MINILKGLGCCLGLVCGYLSCSSRFEPRRPGMVDQRIATNITSVCVPRPNQDHVCWGADRVVAMPDTRNVTWLTFTGDEYCGQKGGSPACWERFGALSDLHGYPSEALVILRNSTMTCIQVGREVRCRAEGEKTWVHFPWLVLAIRINDSVGCSLGPAGEVYCWNWEDNLRNFENHPIGRWLTIRVENPKRFHSVEVGGTMACGVDEAGVVCWEAVDNDEEHPLLRVEGIGTVQKLGVAMEAACVLQADMTVACWHSSAIHEGFGGVWKAEVVPGLLLPRDLACGNMRCCALEFSGTAACWAWRDEHIAKLATLPGARKDGPLIRFNPAELPPSSSLSPQKDSCVKQ